MWLDPLISFCMCFQAEITRKKYYGATSSIEEYFHFVYGDDATEINLSLRGFLPKDNWTKRPRGPRKKRKFPSNPQCVGQLHVGSKGTKSRGRKNNERWTPDEVTILLKGIRRYGEGKWTKVKKWYFRKSVRTAVHLKDKWRNLRKACGGQVYLSKVEDTKYYVPAVGRRFGVTDQKAS
ncbi:uncharacterized protein [Triticum aestivum]|uniref:uncharacterized protein n=1 Tax=Triticum aestivum TaxID=4565 RepID=UPI001ABC35F9|nr:uncharacterized protein LOC123180688 [Triticum aestivum]